MALDIDDMGFTLIELLIVIAIIAILAAIAVPQFSEYRARAFEASMITDLKSASTAMEAIAVDCRVYDASLVGSGGPGPIVANIKGACASSLNQPIDISNKNTLSIISAAADSYTLQINNPDARSGRQNATIDQAGAIRWN